MRADETGRAARVEALKEIRDYMRARVEDAAATRAAGEATGDAPVRHAAAADEVRYLRWLRALAALAPPTPPASAAPEATGGAGVSESVYLSAVQGRREFRQALRGERAHSARLESARDAWRAYAVHLFKCNACTFDEDGCEDARPLRAALAMHDPSGFAPFDAFRIAVEADEERHADEMAVANAEPYMGEPVCATHRTLMEFVADESESYYQCRACAEETGHG